MDGFKIIHGNEFYQLIKDAKPVEGVTKIMFFKCGDIHPAKFPVFPDVETVIMQRCDKNFVYYWANKAPFPNMKKLYMLSHPCDPGMFHHWDHMGVDVFLTERFKHYKERWAKIYENVTIFTEEQERELIVDREYLL
jgi:hypothetical protein